MVWMTGAQAAVEQLRREAVRYAFTVPGESFLALLDGLYGEDSIELVTARHEGGAAFMAEAVGKLTGHPALCMATRGVGSTNMGVALHTARQDSTPLLAIVGQVDTAHRYREGFQEIELTAFYAHVTKWTAEINRPERAPELVHEAIRRAVGGRPGPVLLAAPTDVLNERFDFQPWHFRHPAGITHPFPGASDIAAAVDLLATARRPLIVAGGGVLAARATADLVEFAEASGTPVITAFRRFDAFPNDHPLYLGGVGVGAPRVVAQRLREADVLLAIGTRFSAVTTSGYTLPAPATQVIHIDVDPEVVGVNADIALGIVADAREALRALRAAAGDMVVSGERRASNERDRETFERATRHSAVGDREPVDPAGIVADLAGALPPGTIITGDAGNFWHWFACHYRWSTPGTYLGPTSGAMGYAIPAAVGAALASPGTPVLAVVGDGGFLMTGAELETAVRHNLPIVTLVFNNQSYGTIRMHQEREFPGRVSGTSLGAVDCALFARALGAHGERVTNNNQFKAALDRALALRSPAVIDIVSDLDLISVNVTLSDLARGSAALAGEPNV